MGVDHVGAKVLDEGRNQLPETKQFARALGADRPVRVGPQHWDPFDLDQSDLARQKSYGLWDAQATFSSKDGRYRLSLIGKNLANQYYTTFVTPGGAGPAPGTLSPLRAGSFTRLQVPRDAVAYVGVKLTASY